MVVDTFKYSRKSIMKKSAKRRVKPRKSIASAFIGVDLGGTNVRAGLVSNEKLGKIQAQPIRSKGTADEVFDDLCQVIDAVIDRSVVGIGVGAPTLVNPADGSIRDATNIASWQNVPLKKLLEKRYGVPVRINNDANCFALGEKIFGQGKTSDNFVGLIIGTGLGAGIISRGHLHSGTFCGAGEFGMIPYKDSILEHYASGQFFKKFNTTGEDIFARAQKEDPKALEILNEYGFHLAQAIQIILYSIAPEMIILGGSVSRTHPYFQFALETALKKFVYPDIVKRLKIKTSRLRHTAILGAASLLNDEK
jgi:glucokinase